MVSVFDSGSSGPGSSPCCYVLNSDSVSFHPGAQILMGADECKAGGNFAMASGISSGGSRNTLSHFMLQKPIEKLPPKWLFGSNADLTFFTIISIAGYQ